MVTDGLFLYLNLFLTQLSFEQMQPMYCTFITITMLINGPVVINNNCLTGQSSYLRALARQEMDGA